MKRSHLAAFVVAFASATHAAPLVTAPCAGFTDVEASSAFCPNVEWMKNRAITLGCASATLYCPNDPVSRLAMAAFMNRLGNFQPPTLVDTNGKAFAAISGPANFASFNGYVVAILRFQGSTFPLEVGPLANNVQDGRYDYQPVPAYFELSGCAANGKIWIKGQSHFSPVQAGVVFGSLATSPGPRYLMLSRPFAAWASQTYRSQFAFGRCYEGGTLVSNLVEATSVVDLTTLWTEPFTIQ